MDAIWITLLSLYVLQFFLTLMIYSARLPKFVKLIMKLYGINYIIVLGIIGYVIFVN